MIEKAIQPRTVRGTGAPKRFLYIFEHPLDKQIRNTPAEANVPPRTNGPYHNRDPTPVKDGCQTRARRCRGRYHSSNRLGGPATAPSTRARTSNYP